MRLDKFRLPPGFLLPTAIYGVVAGVLLALVGPPEWVHYFVMLPYFPYCFYRMNKREREESPSGYLARRRRS